MSNLLEFYNDAKKHGFSKDYQLRIKDLTFLDFLKTENQWYKSYFKSASLPASTVYNVPVLIGGSVANFSNTVTKPSNSNDYKITFYCDEKQELYSLFSNITGVGVPDDEGSPGIQMHFELLDSAGVFLLSYLFEDVICVGISDVKYNKDGSGKIQEFTVQFSYNKFNTSTEQQTVTAPAGAVSLDAAYRGPGYSQTFTKPEDTSPLGNLIKGIGSITKGLQSATTTATALRGLGRAIRGR